MWLLYWDLPDMPDEERVCHTLCVCRLHDREMEQKTSGDPMWARMTFDEYEIHKVMIQ